jgi:methionyl-tRNA synthetase
MGFEGKDWEPYWNQETKLVFSLGRTILFSLRNFSAMLKAEGSYILPDNVPAMSFELRRK